ncbi:hypothetical protein BGZ94_000675 [Podila epigama]|nr:hypothetical protein BGZ94_000675 [Podila epigama]
MEAEIQTYKEQVAALDSALQADPANEELLTIKTELLELISLTETLLQQEQQQAVTASTASAASAATASLSSTVPSSVVSSSFSSSSLPSSTNSISTSSTSPLTSSSATAAPPATASKPVLSDSNKPIYQPPPPTKNWAVGDRCRALYAADGKYYEATVIGVATGADGNIYSVQYKGYESSPPSTLTAQELKPIHDTKNHQKGHPQSGSTSAIGVSSSSSSEATSGGGATGDGSKADGEKRKRGPDGEGGPKKKKGPSEQVQKQMAWQNFAKGGAKKSKGTSGILKKSIFATPDNPDGKVGVVGSGKGMTQFQQRGKHIYGSVPSPQ